jgi:hypothetical protein
MDLQLDEDVNGSRLVLEAQVDAAVGNHDFARAVEPVGQGLWRNRPTRASGEDDAHETCCRGGVLAHGGDGVCDLGFRSTPAERSD